MGTKVRKMLFETHDPYANVELMNYSGFAWEGEAYINFEEVVTQLRPSLIVEIGTWIGGSAMWMGEAVKKLNLDTEIVCIDTFLGSVEHWGDVSKFNFKNGRPNIYQQFLSNIIHQEMTDIITPFPIDSHNGLLFLKKNNIQADLIYVDGAHDYDSVCQDLVGAAQILKPGGWILGDDYMHPPVRRAVNYIFGENNVHDKGRKFIWIK